MREAAATRRGAAAIAFLLVIVAPLGAVGIISTFLFTPASLAAAVALAALAMTIRESIGGRRRPQHAPVAA